MPHLSGGRVKLIDKDIPVSLNELLEVAKRAVLHYHVELPLGAQISGAGTEQIHHVDVPPQVDHDLDFCHQSFHISYISHNLLTAQIHFRTTITVNF